MRFGLRVVASVLAVSSAAIGARSAKPAGGDVAAKVAAFDKAFKGTSSKPATEAERKAAIAALAGCDDPRAADALVRATLLCEDEVATLVRDEFDVVEKMAKVFAAAAPKKKGEPEKPAREKTADRREFEKRQATSFESNVVCESEVDAAVGRCEAAFKVLAAVAPTGAAKPPRKDDAARPLTDAEKKSLEQQLARAGELRKDVASRRAAEDEMGRALEALRSDDALAWLVANGRGNVRLPPATRLAFAASVTQGATGGPALAKALVEELPKTKEASELVAVAQSLARIGVAAAIAPLIDRCEAEKGATRKRLSLALEMLTRQPLGPDPKAWHEWFAKEGAHATSGELPLGAGDAWPTVALFGAPIEGRRVVFVLDCSGAMTAKVDGKTQLDRARDALAETLGKLAPSATFDVVIYAHEARTFSKKLVEASPENVKRAQEWLGKVTTTPETIGCTRRALAEAFQLGVVEGGGAAPRGVDSIVLVAASRALTPDGRPDATDELLTTIHAVNDEGAVLLHAVALGARADGPFLKELAEQNGGRFFQR